CLTSQPDGHGMKKTRVGGLNLFFQNIRQNEWDDMLCRTAAFYLGDIPPVPEQVDRGLAEYVTAQIEAPANLDARRAAATAASTLGPNTRAQAVRLSSTDIGHSRWSILPEPAATGICTR